MHRRAESVPHATASLTCFGECAIALQSNDNAVAREPIAAGSVPLMWTPIAPWLVTTNVPAGKMQIVRYLESYDVWWIAIVDGHVATHLRLDAAINGWIIPPRVRPQSIVLLHASSALQIILEFVAILAFVWGALQIPPRRIAARVSCDGERIDIATSQLGQVPQKRKT